MERIEDYPMFDLDDLANEPDEDALNYLADEKGKHGSVANYTMRVFILAFPVRLFLTALVLSSTVLLYFYFYCDCNEGYGTCTSLPIYAPENVQFKIWNAIFGTMQYEETPIWQM